MSKWHILSSTIVYKDSVFFNIHTVLIKKEIEQTYSQYSSSKIITVVCQILTNTRKR